MLTALDVQQQVKTVALEAMRIMFTTLDNQIGAFMTGQSEAVAVTPELLVWFTKYLAVALAENEIVGQLEKASDAAFKIEHMFKIMDGAANIADETEQSREGYERMQKAKYDIIDFLLNRPTVPQVADQTYGGTIPKNVIELAIR